MRKINSILFSLLVGATILSGSAVASENLIKNGSFEESRAVGPFDGNTTPVEWTRESGTVDLIGSYWQAQQGTQSIDLFGDSPGTIYQDITTVEGETYRLEYYQSYNPDSADTSQSVAVSFGGNLRQTSFTNGSASRTQMNWQLFSSDFVASSTTTRIRFSGQTLASNNQAYGAALDSVSVIAIPEPGEWAMMAAGLGAIALITRRRRQK